MTKTGTHKTIKALPPVTEGSFRTETSSITDSDFSQEVAKAKPEEEKKAVPRRSLLNELPCGHISFDNPMTEET